MAMTKKEKEALEAALTAAALRTTGDVAPDVPPPVYTENELTKGWALIGPAGDQARVEPACSSCLYHGIGRQDKTSSQKPMYLYSTKLLALRALRRAVERDCASRLRRVDIMIEEELSNTNPRRP